MVCGTGPDPAADQEAEYRPGRHQDRLASADVPGSGASRQAGSESSIAEQFLHHYEITAEIDDRSRWDAPKRIKPAATLGGADKNGARKVYHPDWQFVDDLSDLPDALRRALLPASGEENALAAAAAWATSFGDRQEVTLTYSIVPVDWPGPTGPSDPSSSKCPAPNRRSVPAEAELRFFVKAPHESRGDAKRPENLGIVLALRDVAWDDNKTDLGNDLRAVRKYLLIVDPEEVVPSGNYGSDGLTDRLRGPYSGINFPTQRPRCSWI